MGGTSGSGNSQQTIRYADYIEAHHMQLLTYALTNYANTYAQSPFVTIIAQPIQSDVAFFGLGQSITSITPLFDIFDEHMLSFDIDVAWNIVMEDTTGSVLITNLIKAEQAMIDDEIAETTLPRLQVGMRDINSVMSSSYIIGKTLIEDSRNKIVSKFSAELKYRLLPIAVERWKTVLDWHKLVSTVYSELMKFYYSTKVDIDNHNIEQNVKNALWPFTVLEFYRVAVGTLQGATNSKTDVAGTSTTAKIIGGALSGAAMGSMIGGSFNTSATLASTSVSMSENVAGSLTSGAAGGSYAGWGALGGAVLGAAAAYTY